MTENGMHTTFLFGNLNGRNLLDDKDVDGSIILRIIRKK
jgi:hypothetical protein